MKRITVVWMLAVVSLTARAHLAAPACNCPGGAYTQMDYETEKAVLIDIFNQALVEYEIEYPGRLGQGWYGNVVRSGDNCDVVHARFEEKIKRLITRYVNRNCVRFLNTDIASLHSIVSRGMGYIEFSHIYLGIADLRRSNVNSPVITFDPWRSARAWYDVNPNREPESATAWGIADIVPCVPGSDPLELPMDEASIGACLEAGGRADTKTGSRFMYCACRNGTRVVPSQRSCPDAKPVALLCRKAGGEISIGGDGYAVCVKREMQSTGSSAGAVQPPGASPAPIKQTATALDAIPQQRK